MLSKKATRRTGITHFPLQEEKISQREVPPRGKKKEGASQTTRSGKRGHRLSRKAGRSVTLSENDFKGSGGKGGKTGGSRAGLLASRKTGLYTAPSDLTAAIACRIVSARFSAEQYSLTRHS